MQSLLTTLPPVESVIAVRMNEFTKSLVGGIDVVEIKKRKNNDTGGKTGQFSIH